MYRMFLNLHMLWMCLCVSLYHLTAALVGEAFGGFLEIWLALLEGQTAA